MKIGLVIVLVVLILLNGLNAGFSFSKERPITALINIISVALWGAILALHLVD